MDYETYQQLHIENILKVWKHDSRYRGVLSFCKARDLTKEQTENMLGLAFEEYYGEILTLNKERGDRS